MGKNKRVEKDSLGTRRVPADAYYGIQTIRAVENFPISDLRAHPALVDAFVRIKKAAALTNHKQGRLDKKRTRAIVKACDDILKGKLRDQFIVDVFQMGAGTSFHMNCNEVIANRAEEILGGKKGEYSLVHPNDHVNIGQSTNDVFPTAMRLAALFLLRDHLYPALEDVERSFREKGKEFDSVLKSGRTHLQDAPPIRLGQEFRAYSQAVKRSRMFFKKAAQSLTLLGIGGSAVGTGLNTLPGYREEMVRQLSESTGFRLTKAPDLREAMQSQQPMAEVSAALRNLALEMNRIANDLRLLASGPKTGLGEIQLPAVAPGSSIMPGKVNPSMLEMMNMVCYQVLGCDLAVSGAVQAGQLELNVMMPVIALNINFMIQIMGQAMKQIDELCLQGIKINKEKCQDYAEKSLGVATALSPYIGYARASQVAKESLARGKTLTEVVLEKSWLDEKRLKDILNPKTMTEPGIPGYRKKSKK